MKEMSETTLPEYLQEIEERANDPNDIKEPMCYVYNTQIRSTITLDIEQWNRIKEMALDE